MNHSDFENQQTAATRRKPIRSGDVVDTVYKKLSSQIIELEHLTDAPNSDKLLNLIQEAQ